MIIRDNNHHDFNNDNNNDSKNNNDIDISNNNNDDSKNVYVMTKCIEKATACLLGKPQPTIQLWNFSRFLRLR